MTEDAVIRVRRVTIYEDRAGEWRSKVQGGNWQKIDNDGQGFKTERSATIKALRLYPQMEELVDSHGKSFLLDELAALRARLLR